jgi:hypothetical protein
MQSKTHACFKVAVAMHDWRFIGVRKSSAARAAHRELRSLLRLFLANRACGICARMPAQDTKLLGKNKAVAHAGAGDTGPKQM